MVLKKSVPLWENHIFLGEAMQNMLLNNFASINIKALSEKQVTMVWIFYISESRNKELEFGSQESDPNLKAIRQEKRGLYFPH